MLDSEDKREPQHYSAADGEKESWRETASLISGHSLLSIAHFPSDDVVFVASSVAGPLIHTLQHTPASSHLLVNV